MTSKRGANLKHLQMIVSGAAATVLLAAPPALAMPMNWSCYGKLAETLRNRHFPAANCSTAFVNVKAIGLVTSGNTKYLIYQYAYRDNPKFLDGRAQHGIKRILIFKDSIRNYLGNYAMDMGFNARIDRNRVLVMTDMPKWDGIIELGPDGPPKHVRFGGDNEQFNP